MIQSVNYFRARSARDIVSRLSTQTLDINKHIQFEINNECTTTRGTWQSTETV